MKMKKLMSGLLAFTIAASMLTTTLFAEETTPPAEGGTTPPVIEEVIPPVEEEKDPIVEEEKDPIVEEKKTLIAPKLAAGQAEVATFAEFKTAVEETDITEIILTANITAGKDDIAPITTESDTTISTAVVIDRELKIAGAAGSQKEINFGLIASANTKLTVDNIIVDRGCGSNKTATTSDSYAIWARAGSHLTVTKSSLRPSPSYSVEGLKVKSMAIFAEGAKLTVTDTNLWASTDGMGGAADRCSYGIYAKVTEASVNSEITGNNFKSHCDFDIAIETDSTSYLDITESGHAAFKIGKHDGDLEVYYIENNTDRNTALNALKFGTSLSSFKADEDKLYRYFNERASMVYPTISNAGGTKLERDIGREWQYWTSTEAPTMREIIGDANWTKITGAENFAETPKHETAKGSDVSGGNWYSPYTATATPSKLVVTSNLPKGKIVRADATAGTLDKELYDALDTVNGKGYETANKEHGATRNLGMSIAVPTGKNIAKVSATVKVGEDAPKAATIYAAKGDSDTAGVGPALNADNKGATVALNGNTHMVMYPLIATKTKSKNVDYWMLEGPTSYKWTYTFYTDAGDMVGKQVVDVVINYATPADITALTKLIADAKAYAKTVFKSVDGRDVAKTNLWAIADKVTAYNNTIQGIEDVAENPLTQAEVNKLIADLNKAKTDLGAKAGTMLPKEETPTVSGSNGAGSATIAGEAGKPGAVIEAKLPTDTLKDVVAAAAASTKKAEITVTLPDPTTNGTVSKIEVAQDVFKEAAKATNAEAKKIVFEVKGSDSASQVKWEFDTSKGVPSGAINLMATPKQDAQVVVDTAVEGLDTSSNTAADLVKFEYSGSIPTGTKVTVPTTVSGVEGFAYSLTSSGKIDVNSQADVAISAGTATFEPKHFSDILISATEITKKTVTPPYTPSYGGGYISSSSKKPTIIDISLPANPTATSVKIGAEVPYEVTNVPSSATIGADSVAITAEIAKKVEGFGIKQLLDIDLKDGKTKIRAIEGGKVTVTVAFAGEANKQYVALRFNDNGTTSIIPATYEDGNITFKTNHFSLYAIAEVGGKTVVNGTVTGGTTTGTTTVPQTGIATLAPLF